MLLIAYHLHELGGSLGLGGDEHHQSPRDAARMTGGGENLQRSGTAQMTDHEPVVGAEHHLSLFAVRLRGSMTDHEPASAT